MSTSLNGAVPTPGAVTPARLPYFPPNAPPADLPPPLAALALADRFYALDRDCWDPPHGCWPDAGYQFALMFGAREPVEPAETWTLDDLEDPDWGESAAGLRYHLCTAGMIRYEPFLTPGRWAHASPNDLGEIGSIAAYQRLAAAAWPLLLRAAEWATRRAIGDPVRDWLRVRVGDQFADWDAESRARLLDLIVTDLPARRPPHELFSLTLFAVAAETGLARTYATPAPPTASGGWDPGDPFAACRWPLTNIDSWSETETGRPPGDPVAVMARPAWLAGALLDTVAGDLITSRPRDPAEQPYTLAVRAAGPPAPAPAGSPPADDGQGVAAEVLSECETDILRYLAEQHEPKMRKHIADCGVKDGTVKNTMPKLIKRGLVVARQNAGYRITRRGRAVLACHSAVPADHGTPG